MKLCALLLAIAFLGCAPEHTFTGENQSARLSRDEIGFSTVNSRIFAPHCVGCHAQYSDYSSVKLEAESILATVTAGRMPKRRGPLNRENQRLLEDWVKSGTPENAGDGPALPEVIVLEAHWESIFKHIITPRCLVCHNPNGQAKFLDLSAYRKVIEARDRIFEGTKFIDSDQPDQSYLLRIVRDPDEPMPPKNSNIPLLTSVEVAVLREWIQANLVQ